MKLAPASRNILWVLSAGSALALGLSAALHASGVLPVAFSYSLFYFLTATLLLLFFLAGPPAVADAATWLRDRAPAALLSLGAAAVLFVSIGTHFRVLADETNLLSASLSLHRDGTFANILQAVYAFDALHVIQQVVPHRPGLFAYLCSLLHSFTGFRPENAFVVNFAATTGCLWTLYLIGRDIHDRLYGLIAAGLLWSFPLFSHSATSAGFDTLNLLLLLLVLWNLARFLQTPTTRGAEILVLLCVLAAQCRYETVLLVIPVAAVLLWKRAPLKSGPWSWRWAVYPFLFLPVLWQRLLSTDVSNPGDKQPNPVGLEHIPSNLGGALEFFLDPINKGFPTAKITVVLALVGVFLFAWRLLASGLGARGQSRTPGGKFLGRPAREFALVAGLCCALPALVHLLYYFGDIRKPWVMRLGNVYLPVLVLAAALPLRIVFARPQTRPALAALLIALFALYNPLAQNNKLAASLTLYREYRENLRIFRAFPRNSLIIAQRSGMYAARNRSAMNFDFATRSAEKNLNDLKTGIFAEILVLQQIKRKDGKPDFVLPPEYRLETVAEYPVSDIFLNRVSRVIRPSAAGF